LVVRKVRVKNLSHADDSTAEMMLVVARCRCQINIGRGAMSKLSQLDRGVISLSSHVDGDAAEMTWPWRDVTPI
jgi:hypothetical protein